MTDYYLGYKNVMIPFEATDDNDALFGMCVNTA